MLLGLEKLEQYNPQSHFCLPASYAHERVDSSNSHVAVVCECPAVIFYSYMILEVLQVHPSHVDVLSFQVIRALQVLGGANVA